MNSSKRNNKKALINELFAINYEYKHLSAYFKAHLLELSEEGRAVYRAELDFLAGQFRQISQQIGAIFK